MHKIILSLFFSFFSINSVAGPTNPMGDFISSNIKLSDIELIWSELRLKSLKRIENNCAEKALIWAYEMKENHNVNSRKLFIHFTDMYRMLLPPESWVYHVVPVVDSGDESYVMDKYFLENYENVKNWKKRMVKEVSGILNNESLRVNKIWELERKIKEIEAQFFVWKSSQITANKEIKKIKSTLALIDKSKQENGTYLVECGEITHISEHDLDQQSWCHTQYSSMYYLYPSSLRLLNHGSEYIISNHSNSKKHHKFGSNFKQEKFDSGYVERAYETSIKDNWK